MTFTEHLEELRKRLFRVVIAAFIGFLACYGFKEDLFDLLMSPLIEVLPPESTMIFTSLPEAFFTYLKVAFVAGVFLASPYIFYQIWKFVGPGLYDTEKKFILPIAFFSALFFVTGALFGYFIVFPIGFNFFMGFATDMIQPMPSLREYLSFSIKLLFAFGIAFELPLFIFFLARLGIVSSKTLRKQRKYAILLAFIASALLTPPDIISQVLMSGPLVVLYELGILVAYIWGKERKDRKEKKKKKKEAEDQEQEDQS
ncbi:twin-arginine translocase subunit TatC [Desulfonatronovibrio hydrogenovorans]|uniref:twin-arginine translocase subunit TatC n=1 Tax=Desulfonatronovibrio hydrogenovorans TaxID=53245 RepID=UPI00048D33FF